MNKDLEKALSICKSCLFSYSQIDSMFEFIYPFTTENINGYISKFDLKDKSLLTVGSSSDQVINAVMYDCYNQTVVDICPYTKYYFYLKKAALMSLDYEEFEQFLFYKNYFRNKHFFSTSLFNKIKDTLATLDYNSYLFWTTLFSNCSVNRIRERLFTSDTLSTVILKDVNPYLKDEKAYKIASDKIAKLQPKFICANMFDAELTGNFDNIFLSNMAQYYELQDFKKLLDYLDTLLNENGKMLTCYLYNITKNSKYDSSLLPIYNLKETLLVLKKYITHFESFEGVDGIKYDESIKDSALIYQKKSRSF